MHALDIPDEGLGTLPDANDMENHSTETNVTVDNNLDGNENEPNISSGHRDSSTCVLNSS